VIYSLPAASAFIEGPYRYTLTRSTGEGDGTCCWVMLNPSTADATTDDPTLRKVVGFTRRWGFLGISVVNLFAWRATDPKAMQQAAREGHNIIGPRNDEIIREQVSGADRVVLAWGAAPFASVRREHVCAMIEDVAVCEVVCLEWTAGLNPKHPLYARYDVEPTRIRKGAPASPDHAGRGRT
jgi:hypothetical protein